MRPSSSRATGVSGSGDDPLAPDRPAAALVAEHRPCRLELGFFGGEPTLDLWATWDQDQMKLMEDQIAQAADLWRAGLPTVAISWFDRKALEIPLAPRTPPPRCGYGHWELTVAPSGRMYPCERMVGDDIAPSSPSPGTLPSPGTPGEGQGGGLGCEEGWGEGPSPLLPGHVTDAPGPFA